MKVRQYVDPNNPNYVAWVASVSDREHDYCSHARTYEEAVDNLIEIMNEEWENEGGSLNQEPLRETRNEG